MAHENSITIQVLFGKKAGRWVNIPSVVGGKQLTPAEAERRYNAGKIRALQGRDFPTAKTAVNAAKTRSKKYKPPKKK